MVPDLSKFENQLREAEQQMGIRPGMEVPVTIERSQEGAWVLLLSLLALSLIVYWMFRSGTVMYPSYGCMACFVLSLCWACLLICRSR